MSSHKSAINVKVSLPIPVKICRYNRRLVATIPQDIARYLDIHEDNAELEASIIEGGIAFYVRRKEAMF